MTNIKISIIVACADNMTIGRDGDMPWKLSSDLKRFKSITMGCPIIMGRKTFQSVGRPLPGRTNIVITRQNLDRDDVLTTHTIDDAIKISKEIANRDNKDEIFIIGGGEIYRQTLPIADILYVTHVQAAIEGDTYFPIIDSNIWREVESTNVPEGERDNYATRYVIYHKTTSK